MTSQWHSNKVELCIPSLRARRFWFLFRRVTESWVLRHCRTLPQSQIF
jgi:hypothetical protein